MRPQGSAERLECRRRLAVRLLGQGLDPPDVAAAVGATARSVQRWRADAGAAGEAAAALAAVRHPGAEPKLTAAQTREVLSWLARGPGDFGFVGERWTAPRVAGVIARAFGVSMNRRYLNRWLLRHGGFTPQLPQRRPLERDEGAIARWLRVDWPRIKKRPPGSARRWASATRPGSC
jgi:transposase